MKLDDVLFQLCEKVIEDHPNLSEEESVKLQDKVCEYFKEGLALLEGE